MASGLRVDTAMKKGRSFLKKRTKKLLPFRRNGGRGVLVFMPLGKCRRLLRCRHAAVAIIVAK